MPLLVLVSASGSPGVTTTALGLALTWPRPVLLVDADPTGGSALWAGYFRGGQAPDGGLLDLALAARAGSVNEVLPKMVVRIPDTVVSVLPGTRTHIQARGLGSLWEPLGAALLDLDGTGQDVIVDAGRLGLEGSPQALMTAADLTLLVVRSDLVALSGARSWAETLCGDAHTVDGVDGAGASRAVGVLLVGEGRPYGAREVAKVLQLPVAAVLPWEPATAAVFSAGAEPPRRFNASPLVRSLRAAGSAIQSAAGTFLASPA